MSGTSVSYEAGFLEEAASSGMSFLNAPANNLICMVKLFGSPSTIAQATLSYIQIDPNAESPGKFKCEVRSVAGLLFNHLNFSNDTTEELLSDGTVHGLVKGNNDCFLSYSVKADKSFSTPPIEASSPDQILVLSPFALEPYVGDVKLSVQDDSSGSRLLSYSNSATSNGVVNFTEGYNYDLSTAFDISELPAFSFSPVSGGGLGRQPCEEDSEEIENNLISINGIRADEQGQFYITANPESCISIDSKEQDHSIKVDSHCPPCCRCADYAAVQEFIRSYVLVYARMAKQYFELEKEYNTVNTKFQQQLQCCPTFDQVTPRVRIWPQHNFKVQIQGMLQNNTQIPVCFCDMKMSIRVTLPSGTTISANELVTNLDGTQTSVLHQMVGGPNGTPLAIVPIKEASYVYFKNVNPGSEVVLDTVSDDGNNVGFMSVTISFSGSNTPPVGESGCDDNSSAVGPNCMDPCEGYNMLTGGFAIVDPLFRKIINLNPEYAEGVNVNAQIVITYNGTSNDQCAPCAWQPPSYDKTRFIRVRPNRVALNPCQSVKMKEIIVEPADPENPGSIPEYYAVFPENVRVRTGAGNFTVNVKAFIPENATYQTISTIVVYLTGESDRVLLPDPFANPDLIPPNASGIIMTAETDGANMYTLCAPNPNNPDETVEVNLAPSSVGYSIRLQ